jgi:hypothetical protein
MANTGGTCAVARFNGIARISRHLTKRPRQDGDAWVPCAAERCQAALFVQLGSTDGATVGVAGFVRVAGSGQHLSRVPCPDPIVKENRLTCKFPPVIWRS